MNTKFPETIDYRALGFKCGLEVHQQLATQRKLFCHCPVGLQPHQPDAKILRHMRPTLSEFGEYDRTALMEFKTKKHVVYELYRDSTCTYEMDDTPPFPINQEALDIAIEIALMFNCSIVDEVHVARKQYLDGSIPTGFQRTAVVGVNGWFPFKGRKITVLQINIEEDSCREVSDVGHVIHWKTDRLSTPLIEVITAPELMTPTEAAEAVRLIGDVTRATGKVRRGRGAARQDVNVSIDGTTRIEIKGVHSHRVIPKVTHYEAIRQHGLLQLKAWMSERLASSKIEHRTERYTHDIPSDIRRSLGDRLKANETVGVLRLKKLRGLFDFSLGQQRRFFDEAADRVRVIACLEVPPLLHESKRDDEAVIVVHGPEADVKTALEEIRQRVVEALDGVPPETRQVMDDGTTGFERILPGPDRMYPDTDSPPTVITTARLTRLQNQLQPRPWEREATLGKMGIASATARLLVASPYFPLFEKFCTNSMLLQRFGEQLPKRLAHFFVDTMRGLNRTLHLNLAPSELDELLENFSKLEATWQALPLLVQRWVTTVKAHGAPDMSTLWPKLSVAPEALRDVAKAHAAQLRSNSPEARRRFMVGGVMNRWRGYVEGRDVAAQITE